MATRSASVEHTAGATPEQSDHFLRLNFSNAKDREAHVHAFFVWLPKILNAAPGIRWERLPSQVMGYLIRTVAQSPDAISITLAVGSAMGAVKSKGLYNHCCALTKLLERLRSQYGMTTLAELSERSIWDHFVEGRVISYGDLNQLTRYDTFASVHLPSYLEGLDIRQQVMWKPYLLPKLPRGFLDKQVQSKTVIAASQDRRKEHTEVVLPLFPLLVEIAQLRKQAAERLIKEFRRLRDCAIAGEIELPYQFQYVDRQFSVSERATTLSEVRLIEREVTLSFTLWNRMSWGKAHLNQCGRDTRANWTKQVRAYAPEHNTCFLQYEGPSGDLLW